MHHWGLQSSPQSCSALVPSVPLGLCRATISLVLIGPHQDPPLTVVSEIAESTVPHVSLGHTEPPIFPLRGICLWELPNPSCVWDSIRDRVPPIPGHCAMALQTQ